MSPEDWQGQEHSGMSIKHRIIEGVNTCLTPVDVCLVRKSVFDRVQRETEKFYRPSYRPAELPLGSREYLSPANRRLNELKERYRRFAPEALRASRWNQEHVDTVKMPWFRGDNPYIWQFREKNTEGKHIATALYLKSIDRHGWMKTLKEDGLFGAYVFEFDGGFISRDLLDSITELYFLDDVLQVTKWSQENILDIGAGYGRLAYRTVNAIPNVGRFYCVDAIPESSFISEYYLQFRGADRATVLALDEIRQALAATTITLATNIHCFSECTLNAVRWWLDLLREHEVRYLLIVPDAYSNGGHRLLTRETTGYHENQMKDYLPELQARGYRLVEKRPKFLDPNVQRYGISPTYHYLFELRS
jgi:putative sugar O-methyltransferase